MKKNVLIILILLIAIALIGGGVFLVLNVSDSSEKKEEKETVLRDSNKEDVYGDQAVTGEKLNETHEYKDLTIKDISFQKRGDLYVFEMTLENKSKKDFYEEKTELVFYTNTEEKMGSQTVELPAVAAGTSESIMLIITDGSFFNACDFSLAEVTAE